LGWVAVWPPSPSSALPPWHLNDASPIAISGRTSYLLVRLAFHPYPQLLSSFCNRNEFGPPPAVTRASPWPWVAHQVSCLMSATARPIQTRFRSGSGCTCLSLATPMNSPAHSPRGTRSGRACAPGPPIVCQQTVSGSISLPSPGFFSPFPHGTGPLSVDKGI
jgi:hypothetical protein